MTRRRGIIGHEGEPLLFDLPLDGPAAAEPDEETVEIEPPSAVPRPRAPRAAAPPPPAVPSDPAVAPLKPRLLSAGADFLIHAGALATVGLGLSRMGIDLRLDHWPPLLILLVAFSFLYTVVSLAFWGQTAGMAWFGLVARESLQFPLSFSQAIRKWLGGLLTVALAGLPLLLALGGASLSDRLSQARTYERFSGST